MTRKLVNSHRPTDRARHCARLQVICGATIASLGVASFLLPAMDHLPGAALVGWLLLLAGVLESIAGMVRPSKKAKWAVLLTGALTIATGVTMIARPDAEFVPAVSVVTGWLLAKGTLHIISAGRSTVDEAWVARLSGSVDLFLGILLVLGVQVSMLVLILFGPTPELVARFALVLATSFFVTGVTIAWAGARQL